ncbi:MAG: type II toxin-antitoxin system RelE/ParE family toxin [Candidatus Omnitrophota bacterium]
MGWIIEFDPRVEKDLNALDTIGRRRVLAFLKERITPLQNPRSLGESLRGEKLGKFWKYRVGNYRIICAIQEKTIKILVVRIGHREEIYRYISRMAES